MRIFGDASGSVWLARKEGEWLALKRVERLADDGGRFERGLPPCAEAEVDSPLFWQWLVVLAKATASNPARRYRSAKALLKDLQRLQRQERLRRCRVLKWAIIVLAAMRELVHGTSLRRYDKARGPFHLWLARLVLWRISNLRRREAARPPLSPLPAPAEPVTAPSALTPEFEEEWMGAVTEKALRRLRAETNPDHYAIYHASAIERLATEDIQLLYSVSASNLYQIRRRLGARFRVLLEQTMRDLDGNLPGT